ncbi:MAG: asparagine synthase (glutamine-hydrolyzing) [Deltaproteobacteria bacterium]|nr:asparagine synthase (glutamine-hydrolyzing) [Deltaproteobacteria bacterium]
MCGIAGIITSNRYFAISQVEAMISRLRHRGPDDYGVWICDQSKRVCSNTATVALGHTRLSVIDVSMAGHQPMVDEKRGNVITYNGEIYNFLELRKELLSLGENFVSNTDTEVILKAYGVWGLDFIKKLRGIFAFAIWDAKKRMLILARDPLGVKPLYVYQKPDLLLFSSEVRALLATGLIPKRLDIEGLWSYLAYGSVQEPFTLVEGIKSFPPAHYQTFTIESDGTVRSNERINYWKFPLVADNRLIGKDVYSELRLKLAEIVRSQLISDVPLGAFLSGGIDSSAIVALMKQADLGPVRTFSLVFEEEPYDERQWSRLVAQKFNTEHTEVLLTGEEVIKNIDQALCAFDQPSMDGLNTYFVSKAAKESGLTVALSGVGGDELFGGYSGFRKARLASRIKFLSGLLSNGIAQQVERFLLPKYGIEPLRRLLGVAGTKLPPYFFTRRVLSDVQIKNLISQDLWEKRPWEATAFSHIIEHISKMDPINQISAFEMTTYMRNTLLRDTDQMSMAHALEVRVPLIDPELVEFLMKIPGNFKLDSKVPKPLLTRPLDGLIPKECIFRPKRGFELPFDFWLKSALKHEMESSFLSTDIPEKIWPFSKSGLRTLWQNFLKTRVSWSKVWGLYVLLRWLRQNEICV